MSKHDKQPRIEITSVVFEVINGAILVEGRAAGTVQFNADELGGKAIRRLRRLGLEIQFPQYAQESPELFAKKKSHKKS
jgi:hypothetical protein